MHYKTNKNQRGAALVEFALVATVFLTVLFGIIEFGRLLWTHNALTDATRRGVRYATLRKNDARRYLGRSENGRLRRSECESRHRDTRGKRIDHE